MAKHPIPLVVGLGVFLLAVSAEASPITTQQIIWAAGFSQSGILTITNPPNGYGFSNQEGYPTTLFGSFDLTLNVAPLPSGSSLISAYIASGPLGNYGYVTSGLISVTPVSPGTFLPAEWVSGSCQISSNAELFVGGAPVYSGGFFYNDVAAQYGGQLAAGTTIQVKGNMACSLFNGFFPFPGFNAITAYSWTMGVTQPAVLELDLTYEPAPVPEPSTLSLVCVGLFGLGGIAFRKLMA